MKPLLPLVSGALIAVLIYLNFVDGSAPPAAPGNVDRAAASSPKPQGEALGENRSAAPATQAAARAPGQGSDAPAKGRSCDGHPLPATGEVKTFNPAARMQGDAHPTNLKLANHHSKPLLITFQRDGLGFASIFVRTGGEAFMALPEGEYSALIQWGSKWCSEPGKFEDGHDVRIAEPINTRDHLLNEVRIDASPIDPSMLVIAHRKTPKPALAVAASIKSHGEKSLELAADKLGHYRVDGRIKDMPVSFLVDTGASIVTVSQRTASQAGIHGCEMAGRSETANGSIQTCIAKGVQIQFGPFRIPDATVAIVPNMAADALLGMNILRSMDIEQRNGRLRMTAR